MFSETNAWLSKITGGSVRKAQLGKDNLPLSYKILCSAMIENHDAKLLEIVNAAEFGKY